MILICEPVCEGYEHVEFNAALAASARQAFGEPVLFLAEPGHLGLVSKRASAAGASGIAYRALPAFTRRPGLRGALAVARRHGEALALARRRGARAVVFSSATAAGLFALKLGCGHGGPACAVVPHGILDSLGAAAGEAPGGPGGWFPHVLRMRNPPGLRLLLLSPTVEAEVLREVPSLAGATGAVDHPYLFSEPPPHVPAAPPVRFASLGVARRGRGLDALVDLAREAHASRAGKASFVHVGPVLDPELADAARDAITFPIRGYAPREEYEREIAGVDYALFLSPPEAFRFSVSGAFLDAVSMLKPVIALRNPFFEHCFERMGDIGYLCDSLDQVREHVHGVCQRFPRSHYQAQQEALRAGRAAFGPAAVGEALRRAFEGWGW